MRYNIEDLGHDYQIRGAAVTQLSRQSTKRQLHSTTVLDQFIIFRASFARRLHRWKESIHVAGEGEGSKATLVAWLKRHAESDFGATVVGRHVWICWCADAENYWAQIVSYNRDNGKHKVGPCEVLTWHRIRGLGLGCYYDQCTASKIPEIPSSLPPPIPAQASIMYEVWITDYPKIDTCACTWLRNPTSTTAYEGHNVVVSLSCLNTV